MIILNEQDIKNIYSMDQALNDVRNTLYDKYAGNIKNPARTVIEYPKENGSVLYMPCTNLSEQIMSLKTVTIFPNNPSQGKSTTQGVVLLSDASNGDHVGLFNASYLTRLRTGAISGLATDQLALENADTLGVIGTGAMAFEQVLGVLAVRNIQEILLFNPTREKASQFKKNLRDFGIKDTIEITIMDDVSDVTSRAQIINCGTRSSDPVFNGESVRPGTHVNGVGSYLPHMREVDFQFLKRAYKIVVDDFEAATEEAGELIHANEQNGWSYDDNLNGELIDLVTGNVNAREDEQEITFFKSVGAAYYDLAVAHGVYKTVKGKNTGTEINI